MKVKTRENGTTSTKTTWRKASTTKRSRRRTDIQSRICRKWKATRSTRLLLSQKLKSKPLLLLLIQARQPQRKPPRRLRRMQRTCWVVRWRWEEGSLEPPLASSPSSSKSKIQRLHSQDSNHHNQLCKKDQDHKVLSKDKDPKVHSKVKDPRVHNKDKDP